jgi:NAD(P)-dependent dehydrogenase (short-subunit alcohol dehydrogenase family)
VDLGINDKVALVTGSHRGTGLIIAQHLAKEGARVIYHALDETDAMALATQLKGAEPHQTDIVWGDIGTEAGSNQVIDAVTKLTDHVDILVNNYGTAAPGRWQSSSTDDWIDSYQKNALAGLRMVQGLSPMMRQQGWGRIVHLGTVGSTRPNNVSPQYYAAKGALANMNVGLAQELSGTGITVNLVSPGLIRTAEVEQAYLAKAIKAGWGDTFESAEAMIVKEHAPNPLGRMATREEVADVVVFVCSQRASFINGQNIRVDGGALGIVQ